VSLNPPTRVRRGRAAPLSPDERRKAIIEAVIPLIVEHGERVTTRLIAEAAGVAEGTIFRVFADKNALLMAAAEETLNPSGARDDLAAAVAGIEDLDEVVREVTARMFVRAERVMAVLIALRKVYLSGGAQRRHEDGTTQRHEGHGPPMFIVEAHKALLDRLTDVFEPFRDELSVRPERAALLLRTLVLGSRHPGVDAADRLSVDEVADALLHGITREGRC
jgi:AcrR family transcriptional regulator